MERWGGALNYARLTGQFHARYSGGMSRMVFEILYPLNEPITRIILPTFDEMLEEFVGAIANDDLVHTGQFYLPRLDDLLRFCALS